MHCHILIIGDCLCIKKASWSLNSTPPFKAWIRDISGISWVYQRGISGVHPVDLGYNTIISQAYLRCISNINYEFLKHFLLISQKYIRHFSSISKASLRDSSHKYQEYLKDILGISQPYLSHILSIYKACFWNISNIFRHRLFKGIYLGYSATHWDYIR